jgi:hypothetical protein
LKFVNGGHMYTRYKLLYYITENWRFLYGEKAADGADEGDSEALVGCRSLLDEIQSWPRVDTQSEENIAFLLRSVCDPIFPLPQAPPSSRRTSQTSDT